jgi:hypothetical protein
LEASKYHPKWKKTVPSKISKVTTAVSDQQLIETSQDKSKGTTTAAIATSKSSSVLFLQGTVFVLCRITPPDYAVDFESKQLENIIRKHGGLLLSSSKVLQILQNEKAKNKTKKRRSCYVICWGGAMLSNAQFQTHFAQVQKQDLCDIYAVTPIWLYTCVSEQRLIPSHRLPEVFVPHDKPIHRFPSSRKRKHNLDDPKEQQATCGSSVGTIRVSVTGWSGTKRTAIIHMIEAMCPGAYEDAMRTNTTHLICQEPPSGPKYEKAIEWKIPVVTVEWLYHVAKHGYVPGSEEQFSV